MIARRLEARAHQAAAGPLRLLGGHRARVDPPADASRRGRRADPVRGGRLARGRGGRVAAGSVTARCAAARACGARGGSVTRADGCLAGVPGTLGSIRLARRQGAVGGEPGPRHLRDGVRAGAVGAHDVRPRCPLRLRSVVLRGLPRRGRPPAARPPGPLPGWRAGAWWAAGRESTTGGAASGARWRPCSTAPARSARRTRPGNPDRAHPPSRPAPRHTTHCCPRNLTVVASCRSVEKPDGGPDHGPAREVRRRRTSAGRRRPC